MFYELLLDRQIKNASVYLDMNGIKGNISEFCRRAEKVKLEKDGNTNDVDMFYLRNKLYKYRNGEMCAGNKTYLTEGLLDIISKVCDVSKTEIVYGNEHEIEVFVCNIFKYVAYNDLVPSMIFGDDWNKYINTEKKLKDIHNIVYEYMKRIGIFAHIDAEIQIESTYSTDPSTKPLDYYDDERKNIDMAVEWAWQYISQVFIEEFYAVFVSFETSLVEKTTMRDLDSKIFKWLNSTRFKKRLSENIERQINNYEIFKIGEHIRLLENERIEAHRLLSVYDNLINRDDLFEESYYLEKADAFEKASAPLIEHQKNMLS